MEQILNLIRKAYPELAPSKKKVASYFMNHYSGLFMDTITELAPKVGVSDTTIINFCFDLGFQGYSGFRKALKKEVLDSREDEMQGGAISDQSHEIEIIRDYLVDGIRKTLGNPSNQQALYRAAELISKARKTYCVGFWTYSGNAKSTALKLNRAAFCAEAVYPDMGGFIDQIRWSGREDVALVFDCARYITTVTEVCTIFKERGVKIILLTDSGPCPRLPLGDVIIRCELGEAGGYQAKHNGTQIEGVCNVLFYLLETHYPRPEDAYDNNVREGVFTRFNPYGVVEGDRDGRAPGF